MAVKLSRHQCQCFAFSYHIQREISYNSVPHIPVCLRLAAKVWLVWPWPYQYLWNLIFYWTSQSHFQEACCMRAHSNLIEPHSLVSTGEHGLYYSVVGIWPWETRVWLRAEKRTSRTWEPICTQLCAFMKICLFLWLCQLIKGGCGPDVKASMR